MKKAKKIRSDKGKNHQYPKRVRESEKMINSVAALALELLPEERERLIELLLLNTGSGTTVKILDAYLGDRGLTLSLSVSPDVASTNERRVNYGNSRPM